MNKRLIRSIITAAFTLLFYSVDKAQPPCVANPIANDYCSSATPICNLNGYCGNTSAFYTNTVSPTNGSNETFTPLGDVFCATIQNNSWLKFIADSTIAIFSVWCSNCVHNNGVQMQIYATTNCYNFTAVSNCWNPLAPTNGQIMATGLVPGNVYFFMIDGTAGDNCDYVIACDAGVTVAPAISLNQTVCSGSTATVSATGALGYYWTSSPPDPTLAGQETHPSIVVTPSVTTTYTVMAVTTGQNSFCNNDTTVLSTVVTINNVSSQITNYTPANCNLNNGSLTAGGIGGTGSYTYLWSTVPAQSTATASGLSPGTYTVTVTSGGCSATSTATVASIPLPVATVSSLSNSFCGQNNGMALIAVTGGIPPYTFAWNSNPQQNTSLLLNVGGGTYTVTVVDNAGCQAYQTVTISDIPGPVVTLAALPPVCHNHSPLTLTGGSPAGGTYSGMGVVNSTFDPSITGTGSFTITYLYTDTNGCSNQAVQTVDVLPSPIVTLTGLQGVCTSSPVIILTGGSPGGGTYTGTAVNSGIFYPALSGPGTFLIIYTYINNNGCSSSDTAEINVFPLPVVSQADIPNICINIPVTLSGGLPSGGTYSGVAVSSGVFDPAVSGLGNFIITYSYADTNGCVDSIQETVTVVDIPLVGLSPFSPVCKGIPAFLLTGGTPAGGTYSGLSVNNNYFNPLFASTYSITYTLTDTNGCSNDTSQVLEVLELPEVTFSTLDDICLNGLSDTLTEGQPSGGVYSGPGVINGVFDPALTGAGTFSLVYTFSNSACEDSALQSIIVRPLPQVTLNPIPGVCINVDTVLLSGGSPLGGTYSGAGIFNGLFLTDSAGLGSFSVGYTFQDQYGCQNSDSATIEVFPLPIRFKVTGGGTSCQNIGNPVNLDSSQIGVEYRLILDGVIQGFPYTGTGLSFSFGNQYNEGVYYVYALDMNTGCENVMIDTAVIHIIPVPDPQLSDSLSLCEQHSIVLDAGNFTDSLFFLWQDGSTDRFFTVNEPGIYWVKVGLDNCVTIDSVEVWDCCQFEIANVFTPNDDQCNDKFIPKYYCELLNYKIDIFNRWGKIVYTSTNIDEGWDGINSNGGSDCSEGTYFYVITYTSLTYPEIRKDNKIMGSVTLLR
jgi:gliding motility-associated-like protein